MREMNAVCALGVSQAGRSLLVLGAIEHHDLIAAYDHCRIERSGRFPSDAARSNHGSVGQTVPRAERQQPAALCGQRDEERKHRQYSFGNVAEHRDHLVEPPILLASKKNGRADPLPFWQSCIPGSDYFLLTDFLSSAPGLNFATLRAAILMVAPVCGLRPLRAFLCDTENVPKPINATRSPLRRAPVMLSTAVSMAVVACALLISQAPEILSTRSALFIRFSSQVSLHTQPITAENWLWLSWET